MRTHIFITIDTEFSIGGAFADPAQREPIGAQNVLCAVDGRSEGLQFMLDTFAAHGIRATFFIETLQTAYFGDAPMGELAQRIAAAGHDLQLHLHPVWTYFDQPHWRNRLAQVQPSDNMHGRALDELVGWLRRGIDTFARWGLPAPVALRTGNLMIDRTVYRAMSKAGLRVASNIARAVFEPDESALRFNAGVRVIEGIVELPVLTYAGLKLGRRSERKSLTITGTSFDEARFLLESAHEAACPAIVLLTHCHEFVKGPMHGVLKPHRLNQRRLEQLCGYLSRTTERFEAATMDRVAEMHTADSSGAADPLLAVPARFALARMVQNKLADRNVI